MMATSHSGIRKESSPEIDTLSFGRFLALAIAAQSAPIQMNSRYDSFGFENKGEALPGRVILTALRTSNSRTSDGAD